MLRLYTDDSPGLRVYVSVSKSKLNGSSLYYSLSSSCRDPFVVLMLSVVFIGSVVFLHIAARIIKSFSN